MENKIVYNFLSAFFALFQAYIDDFKIEGQKAFGKVKWEGEIVEQSFCWNIELNESVILKLKLLCDYLVRNNLIDGDRVVIPEIELKTQLQELGWDLDESQQNINYLCSVKVPMIDEGQETDSFFVHF